MYFGRKKIYTAANGTNADAPIVPRIMRSNKYENGSNVFG